MKKSYFILPLLALLGACNVPEGPQEEPRFREGAVESRYIGSKGFKVYLPASYFTQGEKRYPVLYMMDLQNLFVDSLAYGGVSWKIHEVADSLMAAGAIKEAIIVGIDNAGPHRFSEYMPQKPLKAIPEAYLDSMRGFLEKPVYSDRFLQFLAGELKPHVDSTYRTVPDAEHTFIGGSSMGGLISMYALCEYPEIFGGALCLSTHWTVSLDDSTPMVSAELIRYFAGHLPAQKKWYFDHGTKGLDQYYEPYQLQIDSVLMANGSRSGENWLSRKFDGHDHNETDWHRRVHIPLSFMLGE